MTVHTEWLSAARLQFRFERPGSYEDAYGQKNDLPALVLCYDEAVVIEGTPDELRAALQRGLAALDEAEAQPRFRVIVSRDTTESVAVVVQAASAEDADIAALEYVDTHPETLLWAVDEGNDLNHPPYIGAAGEGERLEPEANHDESR